MNLSPEPDEQLLLLIKHESPESPLEEAPP